MPFRICRGASIHCGGDIPEWSDENMTAKYARVCLAVLCSLIVASGGQAREVTLPQALDLARDHSFVLKRQQALLEATESMLSAGKD